MYSHVISWFSSCVREDHVSERASDLAANIAPKGYHLAPNVAIIGIFCGTSCQFCRNVACPLAANVHHTFLDLLPSALVQLGRSYILVIADGLVLVVLRSVESPMSRAGSRDTAVANVKQKSGGACRRNDASDRGEAGRTGLQQTVSGLADGSEIC